MDQAAEFAEVAFVRGMQHRSVARKAGLEEGVVQAVVKRGGERRGGQMRQHDGLKISVRPEADDDEPRCFDRRMSQEPFHVRLHGGEDDAPKRGGQAEDQQQCAPPPQLACRRSKLTRNSP